MDGRCLYHKELLSSELVDLFFPPPKTNEQEEDTAAEMTTNDAKAAFDLHDDKELQPNKQEEKGSEVIPNEELLPEDEESSVHSMNSPFN